MPQRASKADPFAQDSKWERRLLLGLAFLEGGTVMACELLGAKLTAPFFGSSLPVWAAVLGVTLTALMSGYYLGGYLSARYANRNLILYTLILAGLLVIVMPTSSQWVMKATLGLDVRWGTTLSLSLFMFPPLLLMGMSSPLIINLLNRSLDTSGKTAGSVYAISTFGGILATFATGFYLMPEIGLRWTAFLFGGLLAAASALVLLHYRRPGPAVVAVLLAGVASIPLGVSPPREAGGTKVLRIEEGVMGQIKVVDQAIGTGSSAGHTRRSLYVNNALESVMDPARPESSMMAYIYAFSNAASVFPKGTDALLLGLGGGSMAYRCRQFGMRTDIVEIDERLRDVAVDYFFLDPETNIIVDDARHYLNTTKKTYDLIVVDVFLSETPPSHVLTLESFLRMKEILRPNGVIFLNFFGQLTGPNGLAARSLIKTIQEAGLVVNIWPTPGPEDSRNLVIFAGHHDPDFSSSDYHDPGAPDLRLGNIEKLFLDAKTLDLQDALILDDLHPTLEKLHLDMALSWRSRSRELIQHDFVDNNLILVR